MVCCLRSIGILLSVQRQLDGSSRTLVHTNTCAVFTSTHTARCRPYFGVECRCYIKDVRGEYLLCDWCSLWVGTLKYCRCFEIFNFIEIFSVWAYRFTTKFYRKFNGRFENPREESLNAKQNTFQRNIAETDRDLFRYETRRVSFYNVFFKL